MKSIWDWSCRNILRYSDRTLLSSMRSVYDVLPLRLPAVCWHGKWLRNLETPQRTMWSQACGPPCQRGISKYSSHLIFTFYPNRDKSVLELFHVVVFHWKTFSVLTQPINRSKPSLKLLDYGRKIQNDIHIDTYYRKPELISWRWINITVFHMRFLPPTDQKCAESSWYWQFSIIAQPVNSDLHTWEISLKCYAKNSTYMYYIYIYDALHNPYGFSISVQHGIDCTTFHSFFSWKVWKKNFFFNFQKLAGLWLLAKWIIMLRFMDLRWPRVFRRSNIGLVITWFHYADISFIGLNKDSVISICRS